MNLKKILEIESKLSEVFQEIPRYLDSRFSSYSLYLDLHFIKRRNKKANNVHLFIEVNPDLYFHLKGYTLQIYDCKSEFQKGLIFLTGYRTNKITNVGGEHSFEQRWYEQDAELIAKEIISQNSDLFN